METSNEIIKANIEREWKVPSDTEEGVIYIVTLYKDGSWGCTCPAGKTKKECKHIKKKRFYYESKQVKFDGYNLTLRFLRTDKSVRVEVDTSLDQYDNVKNIPKLPEGIYQIIIRPKE